MGFSVLAMAALLTAAPDASPLGRKLLLSNAYAIGFILVIFGRSELFTEHTTLAVLPVLDGKASVGQLGRLWGLVYLGNLVGTALFAAVLSVAGPGMDAVGADVLADLAAPLVGGSIGVVVLNAILAGWLMGLASWLVTAGRDTTSQLVFVWMVTGLIGLAGLPHCILGSVEVLSALFAGADVGLADYGRFLVLATAGNAVGGVFFVAIVKYAHASIIRGGLRDPGRWRPPGP